MQADSDRHASLRSLLDGRRRDRFVGRRAELELFRTALQGDQPSFAVLRLHGPGGIGKTTLLARLEGLASDAGACVVRLDARDVPATSGAVLDVLRSRLVVPDDDEPISDERSRRIVLLVDSYERFECLDSWVRRSLIPRLPPAALTVIAGRTAPDPAWSADPGWHDLHRVVSLRNLDRDQCEQYLAACGVANELHGRLAEISHGHPLGLSLLADVALQGGRIASDPMTPDLVGTLVRHFVDSVPDERHRRALETCALARVTTESLLHDVAGVDGHELFAWLRSLSFIEAGSDGLFPHELAREVLDADLRWRDPAAYKDVFRAVRDHIQAQLADAVGVAQQRLIFDLKFLFRTVPTALSPVDWDVWGRFYPEPARPDERDAVLSMVAAHEGDESASLAGRWWDVQPEAFTVIRRDGELGGVIGLLDLTAASEADRCADPGALRAWEHANRHSPLRPGARVLMTRIVIDRGAYQDPSPTLNAVPVVTLQRYLTTPDLAWDFLALAEPEQWDDYFALADLPRVPDGDFVVGSRRFGLFGHDFRRVPVQALMTLWTERALAQSAAVEPPQARSSDVLVLSHAEFRDAVRQGLRDLRRPDLLARNPLCRTRLARDRARGDGPGAETVEALLREGIETLRRDPKDDKRLRAVERTYVSGAPTQEAAAEVLGLPFSTYRRHLTEAVDRIVTGLWDQEVYGSSD